MEQFYAKQASVPEFSGHYRLRGSGFGALAAGIGCVAIAFCTTGYYSGCKKVGQETFDECSA